MDEVFGNIVIVGETGAGKSSIINMIAGADLAATSSGAAGCTFESHAYILPVYGRNYRFFDTAGLNEGEKGTMEHVLAIANLYKLITRLDGGINLLIFCMRGPRIKKATHENWRLFHDVICKKEVPTLLVVTGLENEENMDRWWLNNRGTFDSQGIWPEDTACITATRGRILKDGSCAFDDYYKESQGKVLNMIRNRVLHHPRHASGKIDWFSRIIGAICSFFGWTNWMRDSEVIWRTATVCNFTDEETRRFGRELSSA